MSVCACVHIGVISQSVQWHGQTTAAVLACQLTKVLNFYYWNLIATRIYWFPRVLGVDTINWVTWKYSMYNTLHQCILMSHLLRSCACLISDCSACNPLRFHGDRFLPTSNMLTKIYCAVSEPIQIGLCVLASVVYHTIVVSNGQFLTYLVTHGLC